MQRYVIRLYPPTKGKKFLFNGVGVTGYRPALLSTDLYLCGCVHAHTYIHMHGCLHLKHILTTEWMVRGEHCTSLKSVISTLLTN